MENSVFIWCFDSICGGIVLPLGDDFETRMIECHHFFRSLSHFLCVSIDHNFVCASTIYSQFKSIMETGFVCLLFMHSLCCDRQHSNIALGCCLFPFCMRNILLELNKSTNCVVRHDLRFNRDIHFSIAHNFFFPHLFASLLLLLLAFFCCCCCSAAVKTLDFFSVPCTLISIAA